jgi:hypothetical protein
MAKFIKDVVSGTMIATGIVYLNFDNTGIVVMFATMSVLVGIRLYTTDFN